MDLETAPLLPSPVIYLILVVGCILAFSRPYWAFLLAVLLPTAIDNRTMVFSRLSGVGPFFNVYDLCLAICILSTVSDCVQQKRRFRVPIVALAVAGIVVIGEANSVVSYGYSYEALRSMRWALTLPILCALAANIVNSERRSIALLLIIFVGAILAELQHVYLVATQLGGMAVGHEKEMRILAFGTAHVEAWLIAGPLLVGGKMRRPWLQFAAALLFLVGIVLSQTRSIVVAAGAAALVYYSWFLPGTIAAKWRRLRALVAIGAVGLLIAIPQFGLGGFTRSLSDRMDEVSSDDPSTKSRQLAIDVELDDWVTGNMLIGRGLGYCFLPEFARGGKGDIAYGHVGYVTYLSQLGLLGLVVYAIYLPISVLLAARDVLRREELGPATQYLTALAAGLVLYYVFVSVMSGSLLGNDVLLGVLVGCVVASRTRAYSATSPLYTPQQALS